MFVSLLCVRVCLCVFESVLACVGVRFVNDFVCLACVTNTAGTDSLFKGVYGYVCEYKVFSGVGAKYITREKKIGLLKKIPTAKYIT